MKAVSYLASILAHCAIGHSLAVAASPTTTPDVVDECGDLGVMPIPEGEDPSRYRKCLLHPLHNINPREEVPQPDRAPGAAELCAAELLPQPLEELSEAVSKLEDAPDAPDVVFLQACWFGADFGCTSNYCWSRCDCRDLGYWCWTAADYGRGPWLACTRADQCDPYLEDRIACGGACSC